MNNNISYTESSVQSLPELTPRKQTFFTYFYILVSLSNSIIGGYILFNKEYKHIEDFSLKIFIIIFTFIWFSVILIGILIYLILMLFIKLVSLISNKTIFNNGNYGIVNGIYVSCIFTLIMLYTSALPAGIYYLKNMIEESNIYNLQRFYLLYLFIAINIIISVTMILSFLYVFICIRSKKKTKFSEEFINNIENEIKETTRVSGILQIKDMNTIPNTSVRKDNNL